MKFFYKAFSFLSGRNLSSTPPDLILDQMAEKRPLPIGRTQFESWSDRIISGAMVEADPESIKFALADMLLHLSPTTQFESDGYFIACIRKFAINQTADAIRKELHDKAKARLAKEEADKAAVEAVTNV